MTARRTRFDLSRRRPAEPAALAVAMHRQSPAGPKHSGWGVSADGARIRYVEIDGNGDWSWTTSRRNAELFLTKAQADHWIERNLISGTAKAIEVTA